MDKGKKIYFVSDAHLGLHGYRNSRPREKKFVQWLDEIKPDAGEIFLLGDIFDFWFEYKKVVPRGFTRLLGKIAEITDSGIPVHFFTGNHDIWIFDYLPEETGMIIHRKPVEREFNGKKFFIGHGDGLGKGQTGYMILKFIFTNKILQWLFARLHPNFALWLGHGWSGTSRDAKGISVPYKGIDNEIMIQFAIEKLKARSYNYFVFGHRHIMLNIKLNDNCNYINLGDWIQNFSYGVFDGNTFELKKFSNI